MLYPGKFFTNLLPRETFDIHKNSHEFRNSKGRMSVIQLDGNFIGEGVKVGSVMLPRSKFARLVTTNDVLKCRGNHKVLLLQTQLFALKEVIVRVEYPRDVLGEISVNHSLNVVTVID